MPRETALYMPDTTTQVPADDAAWARNAVYRWAPTETVEAELLAVLGLGDAP